MDKVFVLVAEGDVFYKIYIPSSSAISQRWYAGLLSNPSFINCSGLEIRIGNFYRDGKFYSEDNIEVSNTQDIQEGAILQYACIVEEEVFGKMTMLDDDPQKDMFFAGMSSNPECIESTDYPSVDIGWKWNGQEFIK
jgi:hypothetical protein